MELARHGCNIACLDVDLATAEKLCIELQMLGVKAKAYKVNHPNSFRFKENLRKFV